MPRAPASGWRLLLAGQVAAVCWLAFDPHPPAVATTLWDKANHALAFGVMALTCLPARIRPRLAAAGLLGLGIMIELVQTQIPGRSGEIPDVVADAVGIVLGLLPALVHPRPKQ